MKKLYIKLSLAFSLLSSVLSASQAFSNEHCTTDWACQEPCSNNPWGVDLSIYSGYVYGKSKEIAVGAVDTELTGYKISQIDWSIRNLWIMGGTVKKSFLGDTLQLSLDGWGRVGSGHVKQVDRDYLNLARPDMVTDISTSTNTHINDAYLIDLELCYDFYRLRLCDSALKIGGLLGYQYAQFGWRSYGGEFSYDRGQYVGNFTPGELVIAYKQKFSVPYFGLNALWKWDNLDVNLFGKYTWFAHVKSTDSHPLRGLTFKDNFSRQQYWSIGANTSWSFWDNYSLDFKYAFEKLEQGRGDTNQTGDGQSVSFNKSAKIGHFHNLFTLGLSARF